MNQSTLNDLADGLFGSAPGRFPLVRLRFPGGLFAGRYLDDDDDDEDLDVPIQAFNTQHKTEVPVSKHVDPNDLSDDEAMAIALRSQHVSEYARDARFCRRQGMSLASYLKTADRDEGGSGELPAALLSACEKLQASKFGMVADGCNALLLEA